MAAQPPSDPPDQLLRQAYRVAFHHEVDVKIRLAEQQVACKATDGI